MPAMHCDDKRTAFALRQAIEESWEEMRQGRLGDDGLLKLGEMISAYFELQAAPGSPEG